MHEIKTNIAKILKKRPHLTYIRKNRVQKQSNRIQIYRKKNHSKHSWFIRRVVTLNVAIQT